MIGCKSLYINYYTLAYEPITTKGGLSDGRQYCVFPSQEEHQ